LETRVSEQEKGITILQTDIQKQGQGITTLSADIKKHGQAITGLKAQTAWTQPLLDSRVVWSFPPLFDEFHGKRFVLLWRGSRNGFGARDFHGRCDGHANTLTLILETVGNVFGGFAPLQWESDSSGEDKYDHSLKSFLFTLKNPHNIPARKFALNAEKKQRAIRCDSLCRPSCL
jgi:hypothetical protein